MRIEYIIEGDKYQELIQGIIPITKDGVTFFSESKKIAGANNFLLSVWTFESNMTSAKMLSEFSEQIKTKFVDNQIKVKITRDNGTTLLEKTFTKKDFAAHLSEKYLKASVLEGLVFDDVRTAEKKEITLAASVSYPMTDLYVPFTLVVTQDGKLSISKDESMGEMVAPE